MNLAMTVKVSHDPSHTLGSLHVLLCSATTEMMNPIERTMTTNGSTLRPGDSSVYNPV